MKNVLLFAGAYFLLSTLASPAQDKKVDAKEIDPATVAAYERLGADAGIKQLAAFPNLATLRLTGVKVTDACVKDLATLKNLTNLRIDLTGVTDAGANELRKALPKLNLTGP